MAIESQFRIAGHRGAMAIAPENTMRSFRLAVDLGVDELELDVRLSADSRLVVLHDATVDRTTDGSGAVRELTLSELSELDAGERERVPELPDVLDAFEAVRFQIEIKDRAATPFVTQLLRHRRNRAGAVMITSFQPEALRDAASADRHWELGLFCRPDRAGSPAIAREIGADQILTRWDFAGEQDIVRYRAEGGRVGLGPVHSEDRVERAIREGFVGAMADDPRMALAVRARVLAGGVEPGRRASCEH